MRRLPHELSLIAQHQFGLLTLTQLREGGFRSDVVARRVGARQWCQVTSRVILPAPGPPGRSHQLAAAGLHLRDFRLTGRAALELLGVPDKYPGAIDLVGPQIGVSSSTLNEWRVRRASDPVPPHPAYPFVAHPVFATLHAVGLANSTRHAVTIVSLAANRGLVEVDDLRAVAASLSPSKFNSKVRRRVALLLPDTDSLAEWDFARECRRRGLPKPVQQSQRQDSAGHCIYLDAEFLVNGRALAVEVDGRQHFETSHLLRDQFRDNSLAAQGVVVLRVSTLQLRMDPEPFFAQLEAALRQLGWQGR